MPIDPQAAAVLEAMALAGVELSPDRTPTEMRESMEAGSMDLPVPDVARIEDRAIPGPGGELPIRIYWPDAEGPRPVVVFFHGGGWVIGSLDSHDGTVRHMVNRTNAIWVSVEYRLAPEAPFPAAVGDCLAATRWVAANAESLGGDPSALAVAGDSAGANLATVVALKCRAASEPELAFQVLIYPCTDMDPDAWPSMTENASGYLLTTQVMRWFYDHYMGDQDRRHPDAAPLRAPDHAGAPPALIITAGLDPLRDEGEAYAAVLRDAGVEVQATRYQGMFHGFFGMAEILDAAAEAHQEVATALGRAFGV